MSSNTVSAQDRPGEPPRRKRKANTPVLLSQTLFRHARHHAAAARQVAVATVTVQLGKADQLGDYRLIDISWDSI
jgi:hypothetical protein